MGEKALTDEPVYAGEPVLAVAAVDEETAAAAIEAIHVDFEPLPFVVDPLEALRPGGPNPRAEGNTWGRAPAAARQAARPAGGPAAEVDGGGLRRVRPGQDADGQAAGRVVRTATSRPASRNAALVLDETFSMANNQHHVLEPRTALAYWRGDKLYMHTGTQSAVQTVASIARWMRLEPRTSCSSPSTRAAASAAGPPAR